MKTTETTKAKTTKNITLAKIGDEVIIGRRKGRGTQIGKVCAICYDIKLKDGTHTCYKAESCQVFSDPRKPSGLISRLFELLFG